MSETTVFVCNRGAAPANTVKVQLEIKQTTLDLFKETAAAKGGVTPKQLMENVLNNWAEGVSK